MPALRADITRCLLFF